MPLNPNVIAVPTPLDVEKAAASALAAYLTANGNDGSAALSQLISAFQTAKNALIDQANRLRGTNVPLIPVTGQIDPATQAALNSVTQAFGINLTISPPRNPVVAVNAPPPVTVVRPPSVTIINPTPVTPGTTTTSTPLSTGTKVAIGVGVLGVAGLIAYLAMKKPTRRRRR